MPSAVALVQAALIAVALGSPAQASSYSDNDAWHRDNGKVGIEVARVKWVRVECSAPSTDTTLLSPVFSNYLAQLQALNTAASPLVFAAQCRRDILTQGTAACYFIFDQNSQASGLTTIINTDAYAGLSFEQCLVSLGGGPAVSSGTCWTPAAPDAVDAAAQVAMVQSAAPETFLGPTQFFVELLDENRATGGQYVGNITVPYTCRYKAV